jgi:hypothetical protein
MAYPADRLRKLPPLLPRGGSLNPSLGWPSEPAANPWRVSAYMLDRPRQFPSAVWDHAAPLTAIPMRDVLEMQDYFDRGDMPEVEADVNHRLADLLPEPAWDEDVRAFLAQVSGRGVAAPIADRSGIGHRFDAYLEP